MKNTKRFIAIFTAFALACGLISGCSKNPLPFASETTAEIEHDPNYSRGDIEIPQYLEPGELSWFDEHNLEYTSEGNFFIHANAGDGSILLIPADLRINEDTEGCSDGYRNVTAILTVDTHGVSNYTYWTSSFDKYTGTSFEFQNGSNSIYNGVHIINEGTVTLHVADYDYTIYIHEDIVQTDDITIMTYTVTCPAEYDGVVFQVGYSDLSGENYAFGSEVFYADDFTDVESEDFNYFTITSIPLNKA